MGQIWTHLIKCFQQERPEGNWKRGEVIAIGDPGIGKTCLFIRLRSDDLYDPSCNDDEQNDDVIVGGGFVNLRFWDSDRTGSISAQAYGYEGHDEMLTSHPKPDHPTNVFIICFSVVNPTSYKNVRSRWLPVVRHHFPEVPVILVGTTTDLRNDSDHVSDMKGREETPITYDQGLQMAKDIGAAKYVECSAKKPFIKDLVNADSPFKEEIPRRYSPLEDSSLDPVPPSFFYELAFSPGCYGYTWQPVLEQEREMVSLVSLGNTLLSYEEGNIRNYF